MDKHYDASKVEKKWQQYWEKQGIYKLSKNKKPYYSVDTPPPTLSGDMHLGHTFSYSQEDFIVRYHRMKGKNVFYPFGTDDNGLPTERLVERLKKVKSQDMPRKEFIELCNKTVKDLTHDFIQSWKNIGMSCDFSNIYSTIDEHSIKTSQLGFIELYNKDLAYRKNAVTMGCINCQTAIAQAELEDKELDSSFNDVKFELEGGKEVIISTTRPELIGACVAVFVNPKDKRYKGYIGKKIKVPLFDYYVKVYADESAEMKKGSGVLMICSYGDRFDAEAISKLKLKPRNILSKNGKLNIKPYEGLNIKEARKKILEDLKERNLLKNVKPIKHVVNVHDKCGTEIEFIESKQWFVKVLNNKKKFLQAGKKIKWHPNYMRKRYEDWVENLAWDWGISRQRHFGVPFPVWYCKKCENVIIADKKDLPVYPLQNKPKKRCKCGSDEFIGEVDVLDTWATSSLSPQIALNWINDKNYDTNMKMYPMQLRPQAHDIIRTWAFYTIVRGIYHEGKIPWENIAISGHVLDPKGKSMHKSKGNAIDPSGVLDRYGADALRFWAAGSKLGEDLRYLEKDLVTGQKFITKLWNASKFVFMHLDKYEVKKVKLEAIDEWLLYKLNELVKQCTESFEKYEYVTTRLLVEKFFWQTFCDNYLEIVKDRLYNPDKRGKDSRESAQYTLYVSLLTILKVMGPIMPHITEEIYQSYYAKKEKCKSIHISKWPKYTKMKVNKVGDEFIEILSKVRQVKSNNNKSLKTEIILTIEKLDKGILEDLKTVTKAKEIKKGKFKVEFVE